MQEVVAPFTAGAMLQAAVVMSIWATLSLLLVWKPDRKQQFFMRLMPVGMAISQLLFPMQTGDLRLVALLEIPFALVGAVCIRFFFRLPPEPPKPPAG